MKPAEIQVKINIARREMEYWQGLLNNKCCKECKHFETGVCALAGGIMPPVEVQKTGCPEWCWCCIPF
jgi:hypothetical protein